MANLMLVFGIWPLAMRPKLLYSVHMMDDPRHSGRLTIQLQRWRIEKESKIQLWEAIEILYSIPDWSTGKHVLHPARSIREYIKN